MSMSKSTTFIEYIESISSGYAIIGLKGSDSYQVGTFSLYGDFMVFFDHNGDAAAFKLDSILWINDLTEEEFKQEVAKTKMEDYED